MWGNSGLQAPAPPRAASSLGPCAQISTRTRGDECDCGAGVQVRPLRKQLRTLDAWITGQRKDQSPGTRASVPVVQVDPAFEGLSGGPGSLVKFNPLANVKGGDVWGFLRLLNVPVNELHSKVRALAASV